MIPCVAVDGPDAMGRRLLLVGCGKMGGALLAGWLDSEIAARIDVVDPAPAVGPAAAQHPAVRVAAAPDGVPADADPEVVVLAVKPQAMESVLPAYRRFAGRAAFLSVAAGKSIGWLQGRLGAEAAVVRAIPNTPAAIGRGISVLTASPQASPAQRDLCDRLLAAVGRVEWVADERVMDAATALSGSGPAYVFLLMETLARAGAELGLPTDLAGRLARETVTGAAALAAASGEPPEALRRNVTSPGGTTEAALEVLMAEAGLQALFDRALAAAARRAGELGD